MVIGISRDRHWTARTCSAVIEYARNHHQWLIIAAIGAAGVIIAALKL